MLIFTRLSVSLCLPLPNVPLPLDFCLLLPFAHCFPLASFPDCIHVRRTCHHWMTNCFIIIRHSQQEYSSAHVLDQSGPFTSQTGFRLSHPLEGCRSQFAHQSCQRDLQVGATVLHTVLPTTVEIHDTVWPQPSKMHHFSDHKVGLLSPNCKLVAFLHKPHKSHRRAQAQVITSVWKMCSCIFILSRTIYPLSPPSPVAVFRDACCGWIRRKVFVHSHVLKICGWKRVS